MSQAALAQPASPRAQPDQPGQPDNLEGLSLRLLGPLARSPRMDKATAEVRLTGPIPEERFDDVIDHLRGSFFADEPLNRSVRLCERGQAHRELEEHARQTLRDNLSEMALDVTTNQVGRRTVRKVAVRYRFDFEFHDGAGPDIDSISTLSTVLIHNFDVPHDVENLSISKPQTSWL